MSAPAEARRARLKAKAEAAASSKQQAEAEAEQAADPAMAPHRFGGGGACVLAPGVVHPTAGRTVAELWRDFDAAGHELRPVELSGEDAPCG